MINNVLKFLILVLVFTGCQKRVHQSNKTEKDWNDFSDLDIELKGVVYSVNNNINNGNFHGRGIILVNIIESNTESYDPRDKQLNYYCIIKNNKAELYDNHVDNTSVGDTIFLSTKNQTIRWNNKNKEKQIYSISIGEVSFFDYIIEKKLQKF